MKHAHVEIAVLSNPGRTQYDVWETVTYDDGTRDRFIFKSYIYKENANRQAGGRAARLLRKFPHLQVTLALAEII